MKGSVYDQLLWRIDLSSGVRWAYGTTRDRLLAVEPTDGHAHLEKVLARHTSLVERSSDARVYEVQQRYPNRARKLWDKQLAEFSPAPNPLVDEMIDGVCDFVRREGIALFVWATPESPFIEETYSSELRARYLAYLDRFRSCARAVLLDRPHDYGLGNRHYVNRLMVDDFPYEFFDAAVPLPSPETVRALKESTLSNLYDTDHLNLVGATVLTRGLLDRLVAHGLGDAMGPKPSGSVALSAAAPQ
jgi:hypothetical protein